MALRFYSPSFTIQTLGLQACSIKFGLSGPGIISRALCMLCKYPTSWMAVQAQWLDLKGFNWGYRDGPTVKRTGRSSRQPRFHFSHPHSSSSFRSSHFLSWTQGHQTVGARTHMQAKCLHTKRKMLKHNSNDESWLQVCSETSPARADYRKDLKPKSL